MSLVRNDRQVYQWQVKLPGQKKWVDDRDMFFSLKDALVYLNVVGECKDCLGHRLLKVNMGRTYFKRLSAQRILYTIHSKPKNLGA
jgi:hypothetical protein